MTLIKDIYTAIDNVAPFSAVLAFDNVGLLIGDMGKRVNTALVCLDITKPVAEEAIALKAELIISHHPVIFEPLKSIGFDTVPALLIKNGISALCCHTNLDMCPSMGTNRILAELLDIRDFCPVSCDEGVLFSGELENPMPPLKFAERIKSALNISAVRLCEGSRDIKKVFVCSGAGGELAQIAFERGADAFVTGEMKHHEVLQAASCGLTVAEAGHYETEKPAMRDLCEFLKKTFPLTEFYCSEKEKAPFYTV